MTPDDVIIFKLDDNAQNQAKRTAYHILTLFLLQQANQL